MERLEPDDVPPAYDAGSDDVSPLRCEAEGCQNTLTYSGRGRKPKYCDEHKKSNIGTGSRSTGVRGWSEASRIEKQLTMYLAGLGFVIKLVNQYDGTVVAEGAAPVAHEVVEIAKTHKDWRKPLEIICAPGEYGRLMMVLAGIILPVMANHGLIPQIVIPMTGAPMPPGFKPVVVDMPNTGGGVA